MVTKTYLTRINIELELVGRPAYVVRLNGQVIDLVSQHKLETGVHCLTVDHINKDATDPTTAVVIKRIAFNDIASPKFVWLGQYTPDYPEPWASEQANLPTILTNTGYLGWNGQWRLEFTAPVFTWIHGVENLGWIYS